EVVRDAAIGEVLEIVPEHTRRPDQVDRLVDRTIVPTTGPAIVEPQLIVGIPVCAPNPATQIVCDAWNAVSARSGSGAEYAANLLRQLRRDALVGVDRQDPVIRR